MIESDTSIRVSSRASAVGNTRWVICALLFFAATINYIDRQVIGILKPTLSKEFTWTEIDYANIVFAFQLAYAIAYAFAGRLIDRLGTRLGFALAIVLWSLAAIGHAEATRIGPAAAAARRWSCSRPGSARRRAIPSPPSSRSRATRARRSR